MNKPTVGATLVRVSGRPVQAYRPNDNDTHSGLFERTERLGLGAMATVHRVCPYKGGYSALLKTESGSALWLHDWTAFEWEAQS
jgi:hypothetical protein